MGLLLPLVGVPSAVVSGFAYAYVDVYSPVTGYFSPLFVLVAAAAATAPTAYAAKILHCRSVGWLRFNAAMIGLIAVYVAWAVFAAIAPFEPLPSILEAARQPLEVWRFAVRLHPVGWFDIGTVRMNGGVLLAFWILELVIFVGGAIAFSTWFIAGRVLCDRCRVWCVDGKDVTVPVAAGGMMKGIRTAGLSTLQEVPGPETESNRTLQIYTRSCPRCEDFRVFGVNQIHVAAAKGRGGKSPGSSCETIIETSVVRPEDAADIERIRERFQELRKAHFDAVKAKIREGREDLPE